MMKKFTLFLLASCIGFQLIAHDVKGIVIDAITEQPLDGVEIINIKTQQKTTSDNGGRFVISADEGESISFTLAGYDKDFAVIGTENFLRVGMTQQIITIDSVEIKPELSRYQKDSIERYETYKIVLGERPTKARIRRNEKDGGPKSSYFGLTINDPISSLAGGKKNNKRKKFQQNFARWEAQKRQEAYTKYTPELVEKVTQMPQNEVDKFMKAYPVNKDFENAVSEVELEMWIMNNYKEWKKK